MTDKMKKVRKVLGRRVRNARLSHGLTQEVAASRIGIHYTFLGHIERGTKSPSLETLLKIARILHRPAAEFLLDLRA